MTSALPDCARVCGFGQSVSRRKTSGRQARATRTVETGTCSSTVASTVARRDPQMWEGSVVSMHLAREQGAPTFPVPEVRAVAGAGLEGNRYFFQPGGGTGPKPEPEITLIEREALDALARDHGIKLEPGEHRRNVVTAGVPLNDLVGLEFRVGPVRLRGIELCEPCKYLEDLTGHPGLLRALIHRGGLVAQILDSGVIRTGDPVAPAPA
jgi:MOSC domain-containing protein YiiM